MDLGAWSGDFAAYAAKKGAKVYAFEPMSYNRINIEKTKRMNGFEDKIEIVPLACGAKHEFADFELDEGNTGGSKISENSKNSEKVEIIRLDDWTSENNVKVDFIKADIEGFERNMLMGASELLRIHAPILSLCTYHLPDDPQVMRVLIKDANPKYKIIQKRMKLFAYVPK